MRNRRNDIEPEDPEILDQDEEQTEITHALEDETEFSEETEETQETIDPEDSDCPIEQSASTDTSQSSRIERFTREEGTNGKKKISIRDIIGGEILTRDTFTKQLKLIGLCVIYIIIYITNRYQAQQELIEIAALKVQLTEQKYYALTRSGELTVKSRQSHIEQTLKETPDSFLVTPKEPPFIIRVTKEEE